MVFKAVIIHYPEDKIVLERLYQEIADFRLEIVIQQLSLLNFNSEVINELLMEISALNSDLCQ